MILVLYDGNVMMMMMTMTMVVVVVVVVVVRGGRGGVE